VIRQRGGRSASRSAGKIDLSTQTASEAKLHLLCGFRSCAQPGSGCWHSSLPFVTMTGLMHSASPGDPAIQPHLTDNSEVTAPNLNSQGEPDSQPDPDAWRQEVAARLARYRTRRKPRAPRYPSLFLPFESSNNWSRHSVGMAAPQAAEPLRESIGHQETSVFDAEPIPENDSNPTAELLDEPLAENLNGLQIAPPSGTYTNVIEFPRSAAIPVYESTPLADPILDRPRIVEAPEIVPPPPALGGILIEPVRQEAPEGRPASELSVAPASIPKRMLAAGIDMLILAAALLGFGLIFLRFNPVHVPFPLLAGGMGSFALLLWMTYQFLFIVLTGATPGLRATRLKIAKLDGSAVPRNARRWRVLASFLSAFSAGLGYLWCLFDQDTLCWHDRITRTYIQSTAAPGQLESGKPVVAGSTK
jgi:uncharacterized RDD family membrane protein YckC